MTPEQINKLIEIMGLQPMIDDIFEVFDKHDATIDKAGAACEAVLMKITSLPEVKDRQERVASLARQMLDELKGPFGKIAPDVSAITRELGVRGPGETE